MEQNEMKGGKLIRDTEWIIRKKVKGLSSETSGDMSGRMTG